MAALIEVLKVVAVLFASAMLGNWFLSEVKNGKRRGAPWYAPYISIPGILIIGFIIIVPVLVWFLRR